jgi:hypothetical protein
MGEGNGIGGTSGWRDGKGKEWEREMALVGPLDGGMGKVRNGRGKGHWWDFWMEGWERWLRMGTEG